MALQPEELLGNYAYFSTPAADFPQNFLNITSDSLAYYSIEMSPADRDEWTPIWNRPGASTPVRFPRENSIPTWVGATLDVLPGVYRIRSPFPFSANLYGFSAYDSYGYPVSAITWDFTVSDTTSPLIQPRSGFCNRPASATVVSRAMVGGNPVPLSLVVLVPESLDNFGSAAIDYEQGVSTTAQVTLSPIDRSKPGSAVIVASDRAGNLSYDTIRYFPSTPSQLTVTATTLDFGEIEVGTSAERSFEIRNDGNVETVIDIEGLLDGSASFIVVEPAGQPTVRLLPGQSISVRVRFAPKSTGSMTDIFSILGCQTNYQVPLAGSARGGQLAVPWEPAVPAVSGLAVGPSPARGDHATVSFTIGARGSVGLAIVDATGKAIRSAEQGAMFEPGSWKLPLDLAGLPSGAYFVRLTVTGHTFTTPLIIRR
jgi:hypothetical protein